MKSANINDNNFLIERSLILYHCGYEQCKQSHSFGPAIRPHYLIHYILSGKGEYHVYGQTYHLKKGDAFLITPGVTTLYFADDSEPWEYCWFGFDGQDVKSILQSCGLSLTKLIYTDKSNGELRDNLLSLINSFTKGQGNEMTYLGQLYLCFSHMYNPMEDYSKMVYETYISKALDYIHHNYTYDIKISDVAKYLSIDRTYLYKLFMTYKEVSPQQYLINYRLKVAQKLLKDTDLNVTEIAYSCGFKDAPSFNKHFKKRLMVTPLNYRYKELNII